MTIAKEFATVFRAAQAGALETAQEEGIHSRGDYHDIAQAMAGAFGVIANMFEGIAKAEESQPKKPETEANARLIDEAGTVASETGLTPRQLAEQRKELLEALERMTMHAKSMAGESYRDFNWIMQAEAAIAKARSEAELAI